MSELLIYETSDKSVSVRLDGETVWLTQRQMSELFETTPENVLMHLKNIFTEGELDEPATAKDFLAVQTEGKRQVQRTLKHYNLDAIISVGYRVNSKRGVRFRQWATRILREHLTQGYSLNQARLTTYLITRHPGAIEWTARKGIAVDAQIAHLDPACIQPGDCVIGTLPVNLAAEVCARDGRFFNLSLDVPPEARGRELTADDLERFGARLEEYRVQPVADQLDGEARLTTHRQRLRHAQALIKRYCPEREGESIVDGFIAERRAEAARE